MGKNSYHGGSTVIKVPKNRRPLGKKKQAAINETLAAESKLYEERRAFVPEFTLIKGPRNG